MKHVQWYLRGNNGREFDHDAIWKQARTEAATVGTESIVHDHAYGEQCVKSCEFVTAS